MLWSLFFVFVALWLAGSISGYTLGGFLHTLSIIAVAAVLIRILQSGRVL